MESYKIAVCQMDSGRDREENLRFAGRMIDEAADHGARLIAFPETMNYLGREFREHAEPIPGYTTDFLCRRAAERGIWIVGGSIMEKTGTCPSQNENVRYIPSSCISEKTGACPSQNPPARTETEGCTSDMEPSCATKDPAGSPLSSGRPGLKNASAADALAAEGSSLSADPIRESAVRTEQLPKNTLVLIDPQGRIRCAYRKIHLFDADIRGGRSYSESSYTSAGEEIVTADTELGTFGFAICYDLRFPELFRLLALDGAQVIFLPANFTKNTGDAHWEPLLRARAIENAVFMVAPDQCGSRSYGNSMVIDPWGNVLARAGTEPGCVYAEIDPARISHVREQIPSLENRRTDVYEIRRNGQSGRQPQIGKQM